MTVITATKTNKDGSIVCETTIIRERKTTPEQKNAALRKAQEGIADIL